ncbi:MAG: hypothetical protein IJM50_06655 [Lachnospiraceae bacterium]|nr:hypothetical protein [Lachnospiraceae bacterium]
MSDLSLSLKAAAERAGLCIYERSVDEAYGTVCAIVKPPDGEKCLAVLGEQAAKFDGVEQDGIRFCTLTEANAKALMELFPYTKPVSHRGHPFTFGLGDRLGLATPGHVRAIKDYDVFPIFAQQSIRELNLTNRTFGGVIAAAAFGVFQEGYKGGYGADGDHLKTKEEIKYAIESGCSMITLDCSAHIDIKAAAMTDEEIEKVYAAIPEEVRKHYEETYLGKELPILKELDAAELRRIVVVFWRAVDHAVSCYRYIEEIRTADVDFELSIDETLTITTPAEHFVVANELALQHITPDSVAPHFSGEFEKGIEYAGNLNDFARDFVVHQEIADHFGYKLSVHSGSDKFSVFSTVGRVTKGHVHVKTAGTNWLEAVAVIAERDPALYRKAHKFAIENRPEAEKYYHVTTQASDITNIDLQSDAYLPEYLKLPASRQTLHITYGLLLNQEWFRVPFFKLLSEYEEDYYARLVSHIGKHLRYVTAEV